MLPSRHLQQEYDASTGVVGAQPIYLLQITCRCPIVNLHEFLGTQQAMTLSWTPALREEWGAVSLSKASHQPYLTD